MSNPRLSPDPDGIRHAGTPLPLGRRPLALVADDQPLIRRLVCAVLEKQGWRTTEASDGAEALRSSNRERIDLLITDYDMPAIRGLELADAIRRRTPELPILMISGLPAFAQVAADHGYQFLAKPFTLTDLMSLVATLTETQAGAPEARPGPGAATMVVSRAGGGAPRRGS